MSNPGTQFKPGHKKLGGRTKLPPELRGVLSLSKSEAVAALSVALKLNLEELELLLKDPKANMLQLIAAQIVYKAHKDGDQQRLDFLLNRLIGKPKEEVEHTHRIEPRVVEAPLSNRSVTIEFDEIGESKDAPSGRL